MKSGYSPIDCNYYDRLEAWATLKRDCTIIWISNDGIKHQVKSKINNLKIMDGLRYSSGR